MGRHWGGDVRVSASAARRQWTDVYAGPMPDGASHQPSGEPSLELRCRRRNRDVAEDHEADLAGGGSPVGPRTMTGDASIRGPLKTMSVLVNEDGCHGQV